MFHNLNRGYNQWDLNKGAGIFGKIFRGAWNPFEIKDFNKEREMWKGKMSEMDSLFQQAKEAMKGQTRESMTRERLNNEEIRKMLPVSKVLAGLGLITLGYKAVDAFVT